MKGWLDLERLIPIGLLAFVLGLAPALVLAPTGLPRVRHLEREKSRVDRQIAVLQREIAQLRAEVQRIRSDPRAVERVARDELGLVRETEVVFLFGS